MDTMTSVDVDLTPGAELDEIGLNRLASAAASKRVRATVRITYADGSWCQTEVKYVRRFLLPGKPGLVSVLDLEHLAPAAPVTTPTV